MVLELLITGAAMAAVGVLAALKKTDLAGIWMRGQTQLAAGRYAEAEATFRTAVGISERLFGREHWRTALHVNALARALIAQRRLDDAAPLVERAMSIVDRWDPMPHSQLALVLVGAAELEGARGHETQGLALADRAREASKDDLVVVATIERTASRLELAAGRFSKSTDALLRIPFEQLEPNDAAPLVSTGLACARMGDADRAVRCFSSAHAVAERESSGEFAEAFYRGLLGEALARAGRHEEARAALEQAVIDYDTIVGETHPATGTLLVELAAVRLHLADLAGARVACERVLAMPVPAARQDEPYRAGPGAGDPMERERERARTLLALVRSPDTHAGEERAHAPGTGPRR